MNNRLAVYLLHYLLENFFITKSEMARQLGLSKRLLQKLLNGSEDTKGGTIALDKALCFCASRQIPLDPVLREFFKNKSEGVTTNFMDIHTSSTPDAAYMRLRLPMPAGLGPDGVRVFRTMCSFICQASAHICPNCPTWCNPWDGSEKLAHGACYLARMARYICDDVAAQYVKKEVEQ